MLINRKDSLNTVRILLRVLIKISRFLWIWSAFVHLVLWDHVCCFQSQVCSHIVYVYTVSECFVR